MMTPIRLFLSRRLRNQIVDAGKANQAEQQRHPKEELPAKIAGAPRGYESAKTDIHNDDPGGKAVAAVAWIAEGGAKVAHGPRSRPRGCTSASTWRTRLAESAGRAISDGDGQAPLLFIGGGRVCGEDDLRETGQRSLDKAVRTGGDGLGFYGKRIHHGGLEWKAAGSSESESSIIALGYEDENVPYAGSQCGPDTGGRSHAVDGRRMRI
jgi:hypothetical protein